MTKTMSKFRRRGYFFFKAEDGIRDRNVTGVQTCALPISRSPLAKTPWAWQMLACLSESEVQRSRAESRGVKKARSKRSEERRVGKECRYRRPRDDEKKKKKRREH